VPRKAIALCFALLLCPRGATYRGIGYALDLRSRSSVRDAVRTAEAHGLVRVGYGTRGRAVVRLTGRAKVFLSKAGFNVR
jgi:hypothetical protein